MDGRDGSGATSASLRNSSLVVGLSASGMGLSASVAGLSAHAQTLKGVFDILTDGVSLLLCVLWCRDCGVRYESVLL